MNTREYGDRLAADEAGDYHQTQVEFAAATSGGKVKLTEPPVRSLDDVFASSASSSAMKEHEWLAHQAMGEGHFQEAEALTLAVAA